MLKLYYHRWRLHGVRQHAILLYLAEKTGQFLPPDTPAARAKMYSWPAASGSLSKSSLAELCTAVGLAPPPS